MTKPTSESAELLPGLVSAFRQFQSDLRTLADEKWPVGCIVRVDNPRFHGIGEVRGSDECPADKLPVLVESGNTWWYELETIVERVPVPLWPRWIRQSKLRSLRNASETKRIMAAAATRTSCLVEETQRS